MRNATIPEKKSFLTRKQCAIGGTANSEPDTGGKARGCDGRLNMWL
jgi:hypothetical protein